MMASWKYTEYHNISINFLHAELELGFQQDEYLMAEANDQMVCLQVISGMLDAGMTVDVTISTQQLFVSQTSATKGLGEFSCNKPEDT